MEILKEIEKQKSALGDSAAAVRMSPKTWASAQVEFFEFSGTKPDGLHIFGLDVMVDFGLKDGVVRVMTLWKVFAGVLPIGS